MAHGSDQPTLVFGDIPIPIAAGDTVLDALVRVGKRPTGGGTLCAAGDCPNCLAVVGGVAYTRTCQTPATAGLRVEPHPAGAAPSLPSRRSTVPPGLRHLHCSVLVIGAGDSGIAAVSAAGDDVILLDASQGQEVIGIYDGPVVVVRTEGETLHVHPERIVVATGAAEIQPVCPGSDLAGIYTPRAAGRWVAMGIDLGDMVVVGEADRDLPGRRVAGALVRFEGDRRVRAVVVRSDAGEVLHRCDSVVVALGSQPRNSLARMAGGLPVEVVGSAASSPDTPACPAAGTVCPCSAVSVADLDAVWERGFTDLELMKRATLAGTGTCQGSVCLPYLRSYLAARDGELQPAFTARPVARQLTMAEAGAGMYHPAVPRTGLDATHRALGASMDRIGGWWRPWTYGDTAAEVDAVRNRVSLGDVGTLGKMRLTGPGALALLQGIYPTDVASIGQGSLRYVLVLDERGYVMEDGLIGVDEKGSYVLTFTSGGADHAEMWLRDWAKTWRLDVRLMNETMSLGAINVTGPLATELLTRAGAGRLPGWMRHITGSVGGVPCRMYRLSFTGEVSYELHHPVDRSQELWTLLMAAGADLGVAPHGIEALLRLRLEKGHVIVGQDTDYDSTPRRLGMEWAVAMDKPDFVGKGALLRTNQIPLDRRLVGLVVDGEPPLEGASVWHRDTYAGYVTSSCWSPSVGKSVMLGWVDLQDGDLPSVVTIDDATAHVVPTPFFDPGGHRAKA